MAEITLDQVWIAAYTDLATSYMVDAIGISETEVSPGEVRRYAGGVYRAVSGAGSAPVLSMQAVGLARSDYDALKALVGQTVMYRDPLGRKIFGVFFATEGTEEPIGQADLVWTLDIDIEGTSTTEEV